MSSPSWYCCRSNGQLGRCHFILLRFFALPDFWWWGDPLSGFRISLISGVILLISVLLKNGQSLIHDHPKLRLGRTFAILIAVNAVLVHLLLAPSASISSGAFYLVLKFCVLFFLILASIRSVNDLRIVITTVLLGAAYIGFEVSINGSGSVTGSRLEGVGAPGAQTSNHLASLLITLLPFSCALLFSGRRLEKLLVIASGPLILNLFILCNSRGAFLGAIAAGIVLICLSTGKMRRHALVAVACASIAAFMLLGDERIVQRFMTTFAPAEERDDSATSRITLWKAGIDQIADHPFGSGGDAFKRVYGSRYIARHTGVEEFRAVHNGYLNEACEWGIQGLLLRLTLITVAVIATWRAMRLRLKQDDTQGGLFGACLIASLVAFLVTSIFGDHLESEWSYWVLALMFAYVRMTAIDLSTTNEEDINISESEWIESSEECVAV